jgi:hypothetical protein
MSRAVCTPSAPGGDRLNGDIQFALPIDLWTDASGGRAELPPCPQGSSNYIELFT